MTYHQLIKEISAIHLVAMSSRLSTTMKTKYWKLFNTLNFSSDTLGMIEILFFDRLTVKTESNPDDIHRRVNRLKLSITNPEVSRRIYAR